MFTAQVKVSKLFESEIAIMQFNTFEQTLEKVCLWTFAPTTDTD